MNELTRDQGGIHVLIRKLNLNEDIPMDLLLSADPSPIHIEGYTQRGEFFVAEEHSSIIGVYVLLATRPGKVELMNLAVVESLHGNGIGKKLVSHAIQTAKARGFKTIEIGTGNSSVSQLALYQKCGFRIVGVEPNFFISNYSEEIYENGIQCQDMIRLSLDLEKA